MRQTLFSIPGRLSLCVSREPIKEVTAELSYFKSRIDVRVGVSLWAAVVCTRGLWNQLKKWQSRVPGVISITDYTVYSEHSVLSETEEDIREEIKW